MNKPLTKAKTAKIVKALMSAFAITATTPLPAFADAGIPMIFLTFPAMLIALVPVILIETFVIHKALEIPYKKALIPNSVANLASTVAGFPLAWGLLLGLELLTTGGGCGPGFGTISSSILTVILESAWLCPWEDHLYWLMPVAFINCLIIAFFISIWIEYFVMKKMLKEHDKAKIKKATYKANLVSYALLIILNIVFLAFNILKNHETNF